MLAYDSSGTVTSTIARRVDRDSKIPGHNLPVEMFVGQTHVGEGYRFGKGCEARHLFLEQKLRVVFVAQQLTTI